MTKLPAKYEEVFHVEDVAEILGQVVLRSNTRSAWRLPWRYNMTMVKDNFVVTVEYDSERSD